MVDRTGQKSCKGSEKRLGLAWGTSWTKQGGQSRAERLCRVDRRVGTGGRGVLAASSIQGGDGSAWRGLACSTVLLQPRE